MSTKRMHATGAAMAVVALAVALILFFHGDASREEASSSTPSSANTVSSSADNDGQSPQPPDAASDQEEITGEAVGEWAVDSAVGEMVERQAKDAERTASMNTGEQLSRTVWEKEDAVLALMPAYEEVRADYLEKAIELLESVDVSVTADVIELAQGESDKFWSKGSLAAAPAYEHAYLARAILEAALEDNPDNFSLLTGLRHAISLTNPLFSADRRLNQNAYDELSPIIDRQFAMVSGGQVDADIESMLVVHDWIRLATKLKKDREKIIGAWEWLVDNADAGGWKRVKPQLEQGLQMTRNGGGLGIALYIYNTAQTTQDDRVTMDTLHARLLGSHAGSPEFRTHTHWAWQDEASNATSRTKFRDPKTGKIVEIDVK